MFPALDFHNRRSNEARAPYHELQTAPELCATGEELHKGGPIEKTDFGGAEEIPTTFDEDVPSGRVENDQAVEGVARAYRDELARSECAELGVWLVQLYRDRVVSRPGDLACFLSAGGSRGRLPGLLPPLASHHFLPSCFSCREARTPLMRSGRIYRKVPERSDPDSPLFSNGWIRATLGG